MGFTLKISATEEKGFFIVKDCSSYGMKGFNVKDITDAFLEIQPPSATTKYPFKITTYPDFPNNDNLDYEVLPSDVGAKEIESGEWKLKMTVVFPSGTKVTTCSVVFIKSVECCIDKNTPFLKANAMKDPKQTAILELSNMLEDARAAKEEGLNGEANRIIEYLKEQCKCCKC